MSEWYAHGKLLLTGEYLVLEGAVAFALPLKFGQYFSVEKTSGNLLSWHATFLEKPWFSASFSMLDFKLLDCDNEKLAGQLQKILLQLQKMNPEFFLGNNGFAIKTSLDFDPEFGFGSSSTLITNLARWADVEPYRLQKNTFGGSGYDIACALQGKPLLFHLENGEPRFKEVEFKPDFSDKLFFVYLGKKQKSFESIVHFKENAVFGKKDIKIVSEISQQLLKSESLEEFEELLLKHEELMSSILKQKTVKESLFADFPGAVKSLGAWGGDFVLMTFHSGKKELEAYLSSKNLDTFYTYNELIL